MPSSRGCPLERDASGPRRIPFRSKFRAGAERFAPRPWLPAVAEAAGNLVAITDGAFHQHFPVLADDGSHSEVAHPGVGADRHIEAQWMPAGQRYRSRVVLVLGNVAG